MADGNRQENRTLSGTAGQFLISLDFELYWGVHDSKTIDHYGDAIRGGRKAVSCMLDLFSRHEVRATWATVGLLFFKNAAEAIGHMPTTRPNYRNHRLDSYRLFDRIGTDPTTEDLLFARDLILEIKGHQEQEIGTHTFCHYYCWDDGDHQAAFRADLSAAIEGAARLGIELKSIVFPRNQVNKAYLPICRELGIVAFRDRPTSSLFSTNTGRWGRRLKRIGRIADSFARIDTPHLRGPIQVEGEPVSLVGSRFLRADAVRSPILKTLHLRRIKDEMTRAATEGGYYHLWWHPHNFGIHLEAKLALLNEVLDHYQSLRVSYGMESSTMLQAAEASSAMSTINQVSAA